MAGLSHSHNPILVRLTFFLCLCLTFGILSIFAIDYFLLQTRKFQSPFYLLSLFLPVILLLVSLYQLSFRSNSTLSERKGSSRKRLGTQKHLYYGIIISLSLICLLSYLADIPKPDIILLQAAIFVLGLLGITIFVYPQLDWSKVYLLVATLIVTVVLLEVTSRLLLGSTKLFRVYAQFTTSRSDDDQLVYLDYGDVNVPPKQKLFREGGELLPELDVWVVGANQEEKVRFITNSKGFRNQQEFSYEPAADTYRIIYIGDSFVAGYRVDQNFTSAKIMEDKLRELSQSLQGPRHVEVLAVTIGEPAAAWLWLEEYGVKYKPDLIILGLTLGNDLYQTYIATDPDSYLEVVDHQIVQKGLPSIGFRTPPLNQLYLPADAFLFGPDQELPSTLFWQIVYRLKAKFSWTSLGILINRVTGDPVAIASWYQDTFPGQVYAFDPTNGFGLFYTPTVNQVDQSFLRIEKVLQGLNERAQAQGSDFLLVLFPQRFQVTEADWTSAQQRYTLNPHHFDLTYPNRRLREICTEHDITCFDLLNEFKNTARSSSEPLYLPLGDMHWNSNGHKIAGIAIAQFVWQEYLGPYSH